MPKLAIIGETRGRRPHLQKSHVKEELKNGEERQVDVERDTMVDLHTTTVRPDGVCGICFPRHLWQLLLPTEQAGHEERVGGDGDHLWKTERRGYQRDTVLCDRHRDVN